MLEKQLETLQNTKISDLKKQKLRKKVIYIKTTENISK